MYMQTRQLDKLFGKLDAISQQTHRAQSGRSKHIPQKLQRVAATLSKTTCKLDHMTGDFDPRESDATEYQAA